MARRMHARPIKKKMKELVEGKNKSQIKISKEGRVIRCRI